MKELKIYEFQAKEIEDALRMVNNAFACHLKTTCLDRTVMRAYEMIQNIIAEQPDKQIKF